jgi:rhomboid protease GluP
MVVAYDAKSATEARAVVELLESNQIPSVVNLEVDGILFPWQEPPKKGVARVMVPSTMLHRAREILRRSPQAERGLRALPVKPVRTVTDSVPQGESRPQTPELIPESVAHLSLRAPLPARDDPFLPEADHQTEEDGPLDFPLPEPSPLPGRILLAMLAIAFGLAFQRVLEGALEPHSMLARFAAQWPATQQVWRLVTAGFLHMSFEHFVSNAVFAIVLGVVLFGTHEIGATSFVWLLASISGLFVEASLSPEGVMIAGASAGNYGLVGLWASGQLQRSRVSLLPRREVIRTIGILLLLVPGALTPITSTGTKIAVLAHAGGFLAGFVLGFIFERRLLPARLAIVAKRSRIAMALALLIVGATLVRVVMLLSA